MRARPAPRGFSLVEALVALLVLSVGMIGIAAMYGQGLAAGRTAQLRYQAVTLTADMADRIRLNPLGRAAYEGPAADRLCDAPPNGRYCTPAEMAAHDLFQWQAQAVQLLPNGEARIGFDGAAVPPAYAIELSWDEAGQGRLSRRLVIRVPDH